jgi:hypothetical protein
MSQKQGLAGHAIFFLMLLLINRLVYLLYFLSSEKSLSLFFQEKHILVNLNWQSDLSLLDFLIWQRESSCDVPGHAKISSLLTCRMKILNVPVFP